MCTFVAAAIDGVTGELFQSRLSPCFDSVRSWIRDLPGPVAVAYEAGPTEFGLYRHLSAAGIRCEVVAPSKLQKPTGDRVKTDAKDALHLARLLRLDEIVSVAIPTLDQEAARDLVRAREDARGDLMRARHRLSKLLLRYGIVYYGGKAWTSPTTAGCGTMRWPSSRRPVAVRSGPASRRLRRPAHHPRSPKPTRRADPHHGRRLGVHPVVRRLGCLRGIATLTAFALAVEIGNWRRFTGRTIGSFVGLLPTEYSSGRTRAQGPITKTGNGHARRLLVEAAWHHRSAYRPSKPRPPVSAATKATDASTSGG